MMIFRTALALLLAADTAAFFVSPNSQIRQPFVSRRVSLSSDTTTSADVQAEEESPSGDVVVPQASSESSDSTSAPAPAASSEMPEKVRHTIYCGNLPYGISVTEVKELFAEHCNVQYVSLPRNNDTGEIKGFAFIDVVTEEDIPKAVAALSGLEMSGRALRVSKVLPKDQIRSKKTGQFDNANKLFVGNIPFTATTDDIRELFSQFGGITDVFIPVDPLGEPRGFAFVTVADGDVDAVMEGGNASELMGRTLFVNPPLAPGQKAQKRGGDRTDRQKLYVGNLSFYTNEETLMEVFEEFGEVHDTYIPQDPERGSSRGFGFVTMDAAPAKEAVDSLDGCELDGRIISVNEAKAKTKRKDVAVDEDADTNSDNDTDAE